MSSRAHCPSGVASTLRQPLRRPGAAAVVARRREMTAPLRDNHPARGPDRTRGRGCASPAGSPATRSRHGRGPVVSDGWPRLALGPHSPEPLDLRQGHRRDLRGRQSTSRCRSASAAAPFPATVRRARRGGPGGSNPATPLTSSDPRAGPDTDRTPARRSSPPREPWPPWSATQCVPCPGPRPLVGRLHPAGPPGHPTPTQPAYVVARRGGAWPPSAPRLPIPLGRRCAAASTPSPTPPPTPALMSTSGGSAPRRANPAPSIGRSRSARPHRATRTPQVPGVRIAQR